MKGGWLVRGDNVTARGNFYYWFEGIRQGRSKFAGSVMNEGGQIVGSWDAALGPQ